MGAYIPTTDEVRGWYRNLGHEIDERYWEIAAERLRARTRQTMPADADASEADVENPGGAS
jgi:hypothetical protein